MLLCARLRSAAREISPAVALAALFALWSAAPAVAQETRAEEIAEKQREKAAKSAPYVPSKIESFLIRLEENFASPPNGFYPELGKIYQGGGFSAGGGYRRFFARNAVWNVRGLYSVRNYKQVEVGTRTPWHTNGRYTADIRVGWLDAPQVRYYGVGMAEPAPRSEFHLTYTYLTALGDIRPTPWTRLIAQVGFDDYSTKTADGRAPSVETIYTGAAAPGLLADPAFFRTEATAAIDWRPAEGYARKGGYYGVTLASFNDHDDVFDFQRIDGEVIQHIPILRENWVISLRGRVQSILDDDDVVPFFLLPQLGSGRTLRGYDTGRFRDRHSILTSAEFRWIPNRLALDLAVFYDAGKVTNRREDLDFESLKSDWGIGARFHGPTTTVLRIEGARGTDGWRLVVTTSAAF